MQFFTFLAKKRKKLHVERGKRVSRERAARPDDAERDGRHAGCSLRSRMMPSVASRPFAGGLHSWTMLRGADMSAGANCSTAS